MKKRTLTAPGKKPISFTPGGLHATTNTPVGQDIPAEKMKRARAGGYGVRGKRQADFARNVLKKK